MKAGFKSLSDLIEDRSPSGKAYIFITILLAVSVAQYSNIIWNDFVWDSNFVFLGDSSTREFASIPTYFTRAHRVMEDAGPALVQLEYYRPMVKILHLLEFKLFGQTPMGYKIVSIVLNALAVVLGFYAVRKATGSSAIAFVASLLYAVNPTRVEAVSWSYSDSYLLMSIFSLLAFIYYQKEMYLRSASMFCLALMSWEGAVLFPAVLVAYEVLLRNNSTIRKYMTVIPFILLLILYFIVRSIVVGPLPVSNVPLVAFINTVLVIITKAVKITFFPDGPVTIYKFHLYQAITKEVIISYLAVAGIIISAAVMWKRDKAGLFWASWFMVWLAISFNVGKLAEYLISEKFMVLAVLGPCVLLARTIRFKGLPSLIAGVCIASLLVFNFAYTFHRNSFYTDSITFLEEALRFQPDFQIGLLAIGPYYMGAGEYEKAISSYGKLKAYYPDAREFSDKTIASAYRKKANNLLGQKDYKGALASYESSLNYMPANADTLNKMGIALLSMGRADEAVKKWNEALESDPSDPGPLVNIAVALEGKEKFSQALKVYERYIASGPNNPALKQKVLSRITVLKRRTQGRD